MSTIVDASGHEQCHCKAANWGTQISVCTSMDRDRSDVSAFSRSRRFRSRFARDDLDVGGVLMTKLVAPWSPVSTNGSPTAFAANAAFSFSKTSRKETTGAVSASASGSGAKNRGPVSLAVGFECVHGSDADHGSTGTDAAGQAIGELCTDLDSTLVTTTLDLVSTWLDPAAPRPGAVALAIPLFGHRSGSTRRVDAMEDDNKRGCVLSPFVSTLLGGVVSMAAAGSWAPPEFAFSCIGRGPT